MTATPVPRTWTTGEIVTAANMNTFISNVLTFLLNPPILRIRQTVTQSIANNTSTALLFDTEDIDSSGMHSTSSNTSRATAVYPGWYWVGFNTSLPANATGNRFLSYAINGSAQNGANATQGGSTNDARVASAPSMFFLNAGDFLECDVTQTSGGALSTEVTGGQQSSLSLHWISN